jgi:hypothetical protein
LINNILGDNMDTVKKKAGTPTKMDLREIGWGSMDWIDPAQDRDQWRALVNMVTILQIP